MTSIMLRIVDGPQRGQVCEDLVLPVTVGREKGNSIEITDSRMSRFHFKIFQEAETMLLVDLDSTNGTRVNGETVQIWSLRPGDLISAGASLFLYGTPLQIANRLKVIRKRFSEGEAALMGTLPAEAEAILSVNDAESSPESVSNTAALILQEEFFRESNISAEDLGLLRSLFPPSLPEGLTPIQVADLHRYLLYICLRFRTLLDAVRSVGSSEIDLQTLSKAVREARLRKDHPSQQVNMAPDRDQRVTFPVSQWENLLDLLALLSEDLHDLTEPEK